MGCHGINRESVTGPSMPYLIHKGEESKFKKKMKNALVFKSVTTLVQSIEKMCIFHRYKYCVSISCNVLKDIYPSR